MIGPLPTSAPPHGMVPGMGCPSEWNMHGMRAYACICTHMQSYALICIHLHVHICICMHGICM